MEPIGTETIGPGDIEVSSSVRKPRRTIKRLVLRTVPVGDTRDIGYSSPPVITGPMTEILGPVVRERVLTT